jgi:hypothetical protein
MYPARAPAQTAAQGRGRAREHRGNGGFAVCVVRPATRNGAAN